MHSFGAGLGTAVLWGSVGVAAIAIIAGVLMLSNGNSGGIALIILGVVALGGGYYYTRQLRKRPQREKP